MRSVTAKKAGTRLAANRGKAGDPVREVIQHARTAGSALGQIVTSMMLGEYAAGGNSESGVCLTVSRRKVSGLMLEFSTSSPGRRQTIKMMLVGDQAFLEIPGSAKLAQRLEQMASGRRRRSPVQDTVSEDTYAAIRARVPQDYEPSEVVASLIDQRSKSRKSNRIRSRNGN